MDDAGDALSPEGVSALASFIIRPPRARYARADLGPRRFAAAQLAVARSDLELRNPRGHALQCSHFAPAAHDARAPLPAVVYLHGNGSCRVEATMMVPYVLPYGFSLFAFDFSGSGRSDGEFISLGVNEKDDVATVVSYLVNEKKVPKVALWGHSMGAATAVMYAGLCKAAPPVHALILDSPFASFDKLAHSMVAEMPLPVGVPRKLVLSVGVRAVRKAVRDRAGFDVFDIDPMAAAKKVDRALPALFLHGSADSVVPVHHGELLHKSYAGKDKQILLLKRLEHDTPRPEWAMDRVFLFLQTHLRSNGDVADSAFLEQLKARGNVAMIAGRFKDAVFLYTAALDALAKSVCGLDYASAVGHISDETQVPHARADNSEEDSDKKSASLVRRASSISGIFSEVKRWRSLRIRVSQDSETRKSGSHRRRSQPLVPGRDAMLAYEAPGLFKSPPPRSENAPSMDGAASSSASGRFSRQERRLSARARGMLGDIKRKMKRNTPPGGANDDEDAGMPRSASWKWKRSGRFSAPARPSGADSDRRSEGRSMGGGFRYRRDSNRRGDRFTESSAGINSTSDRNGPPSNRRSFSLFRRAHLAPNSEKSSVPSTTDESASQFGSATVTPSASPIDAAREHRAEERAAAQDGPRSAREGWRQVGSSVDEAEEQRKRPKGESPHNRRASVAVTQSLGARDRLSGGAAEDIGDWDITPEQRALALALLGNRSLARRKNGDISGALFDAVMSLRLDPTWTRGFLRKAAALRLDGKLELARKSLLEGLVFDPEHAGLSDMLDAVNEAIEAEAKASRRLFTEQLADSLPSLPGVSAFAAPPVAVGDEV